MNHSGNMKNFITLVFCLTFGLTTAFRGNTNRGSSSLGSNSQSLNQLNIGLIAPHTNFGELISI